MTEIRPRWEWRSFGRRFGVAEERLARLAPSGVQERDEIYLLSGAGENVKVRDALMDIKVLREVNADGELVTTTPARFRQLRKAIRIRGVKGNIMQAL